MAHLCHISPMSFPIQDGILEPGVTEEGLKRPVAMSIFHCQGVCKAVSSCAMLFTQDA
jgi:hypothetical protein